jgi:AcrR family transcriptional regulator
MIKNTKAGFIRQPKKLQGNPLKEMPELFDAALTEFSENSFDQASLNNIIKASGSNKGSFYYRFSDKTDLYLCLIDKIAEDKTNYFAVKASSLEFPEDFFEQFRLLCSLGMEYAMHEPRYYKLWRTFLIEKPEIRQAVKEAFPMDSFDTFHVLISKANEKGQFEKSFSKDFIVTIIELLLNNIDALISQNMNQDEIIKVLDELIMLIKNGIAAQ